MLEDPRNDPVRLPVATRPHYPLVFTFLRVILESQIFARQTGHITSVR
jgi:hypothetical protein